MKKHTTVKPPPPRLRKALALTTAAALLIAGTVAIGFASAGERTASSPGPALATPTLNPAKTEKAAVAYLVGAGLSAKQAELRITRQPAQLAAADRIRRQAPGGVQDVWIDDDGQLVANVLNDNGEKIARAAGATPRLVPRATEDLQAVIDKLAEDALRNPPADFSGASFEIDPQTNKVLARYMLKAEGGKIPELATQLGDTVTATTEVGTLAPTAYVRPGQETTRKTDKGDLPSCTTGWAVQERRWLRRSDPPQGVLTAGHCFDIKKPAESSVFTIDTSDGGTTEAIGQAYAFGGTATTGTRGYAPVTKR